MGSQKKFCVEDASCVEGGHLLLFRHDEDYHHQCRKY